MTMQLRWLASGSTSCFHAVRRLLEGHVPVQRETAAAVGESAVELHRFLIAHGMPQADLIRQLVPVSIREESNRELATIALAKTLSGDWAHSQLELLSGLITDCEQAYFRAFPKLMDELELRSRPLRELWDTHGPGVLAGVGRLTERRLLVEEATVAVVLPYSGGGGAAYAAHNSVTIEAVLANPIAALPETIRLAWLLASLNVDLPDVAEQFGPGRAETVLPLALVPAVLEAAADLEVVRPTDTLLATALTAWEAPLPAGERTAELVRTWWTTRQERGTKWPVAVAALEQMLFEEA